MVAIPGWTPLSVGSTVLRNPFLSWFSSGAFDIPCIAISVLLGLCVCCPSKGLIISFPSNHINDPYLEATVEGSPSSEHASAAVLALVAAQSETDTICPSELVNDTVGLNRYKGNYISGDSLLVFRFRVPSGRMKMCLINTLSTENPDITSFGQAPLASTPEKIGAAEARCSLSPKGDCAISLSPDPATISGSWVCFLPAAPLLPRAMMAWDLANRMLSVLRGHLMICSLSFLAVHRRYLLRDPFLIASVASSLAELLRMPVNVAACFLSQHYGCKVAQGKGGVSEGSG